MLKYLAPAACLCLSAVLASSAGAGPAAQWRFDETAGAVAHEIISGFDGTLANMNTAAAWVGGRIDGAIRFDGLDDYVALPDMDLNTNTLTISLWLNSAAAQNSYTGLVFRRTQGEDATGFGFTSGNQLGYHWNNTQWDWQSGLVVPNGRWVFAAIVFEPAQATVYLGDPQSGNLQSAVNSHDEYTEKFNSVAIGADTYFEGGRYFNGSIDEVTVWTEAVSAEQIEDLFTRQRAFRPDPADGETYVPLEPALCWWPGEDAALHEIYLGMNASDVGNATPASDTYMAQQPADANTFAPGALDLGTTYYWRIDEVNTAHPSSPWKGRLWSFTTDDGKTRDPYPPDQARTMPAELTLSWTAGIAADSHDVYFGTDPAAVAAASRLAGDASGDGPVDWLDIAAVGDSWLAAVPAGGADVSGDGTVNFRDHAVVAGQWPSDANPCFAGNVAADSFGISGLELDGQYHWRVDAVGGTGIITGDVWSFQTGISFGPQHVIVRHQAGKFAGWPANGGIFYNWGDDELVVGFEIADFACQDGHDNSGNQYNVLARSTDGGFNWTTFDPPNWVNDGGSASGPPGGINFTHPDFALRVFHELFWISYDRCSSWSGPYTFGSLGDSGADGSDKTGRTDYIINGPADCHLLLSGKVAGTDNERVFCVRTTDGGASFRFQGWVVPPDDPYGALMPSTVRCSATKLVSAIRRVDRGCNRWVDVYVSEDNGVNWSHLAKVGVTGCSNGNPPALVRLDDGRLCCAYGNRSYGKMYMKYSENDGQTWGPEITLRGDFESCDGDFLDLGYPRITQLHNGRVICAYYWSTAAHVETHIAATIWKD
jgi:hypothetical protein